MSLGNVRKEHWYLETEVSEQNPFIVSFEKQSRLVFHIPFWSSLDNRIANLIPLQPV